MSKPQHFLIFSALAILLVGSVIIVAKLLPREKTHSTPEETGFKWGIYTNPFALSDLNDGPRPEAYDEQLQAIKALGVKYVRTNYETGPAGLNEAWIAAIKRNGLEPILILDIPYIQNYSDAYDFGKKIATQFKSEVRYFQLLNEVSGSAVKPGYPGLTINEFDQQKYEQIRGVLKGYAQGIRAGNPQAQRIITSHWLGLGIIDQLITDEVPFEIIGWDWFSDMGPNLTDKILDDGTHLDIPAHFAKTKKGFWIMEANRQGGSFPDNEEEQASYLTELARKSAASPYISGFFVYRFTDGAENAGKSAWGLYKTKPTANGSTLGLDQAKKAYGEYRNVIENIKTRN